MQALMYLFDDIIDGDNLSHIEVLSFRSLQPCRYLVDFSQQLGIVHAICSLSIDQGLYSDGTFEAVVDIGNVLDDGFRSSQPFDYIMRVLNL